MHAFGFWWTELSDLELQVGSAWAGCLGAGGLASCRYFVNAILASITSPAKQPPL